MKSLRKMKKIKEILALLRDNSSFTPLATESRRVGEST